MSVLEEISAKDIINSLKQEDEKRKDEFIGLNDDNVETALRKCGGWVSQAARQLSVDTYVLKKYLELSPNLQRCLEDIKDEHLDLAEFELIKKVKKGDLQAIKLWLMCQGKKRGWTYDSVEEDDNKKKQIIINFTPVQQSEFIKTIDMQEKQSFIPAQFELSPIRKEDKPEIIITEDKKEIILNKKEMKNEIDDFENKLKEAINKRNIKEIEPLWTDK